MDGCGARRRHRLVGFDFSFAPPIAERGEYLPGERGIPSSAREFWAYVDRRCEDEDLGAASFLERAHRRHFYFGIADGVKARFMHFRQCDARLNAQGGRKTASAYDAIGAAQVAKASFSGMRLLHRLDGRVAIWPMDPLPGQGSAVVEIYTRIYLRRAGLRGTKLRTRAELDLALNALGSRPAHLRSSRTTTRRRPCDAAERRLRWPAGPSRRSLTPISPHGADVRDPLSGSCARTPLPSGAHHIQARLNQRGGPQTLASPKP